jgi:hypothetical protein
MEREEFLGLYRHSMAHILAKAVIEIYGKEVQYAIGPQIDDGCYYDFVLPKPVTQDDFKMIEDKMREIIKRREDWTRKEVTKAEALELIRRFYNLGFNIEATSGTAKFLKEHGIRTHALKKISEGSNEIPESIRQGHVAYIINTREIGAADSESDGLKIRQCATENNATIFTSLDTVRVLLDVLEETTLTISTIDA